MFENRHFITEQPDNKFGYGKMNIFNPPSRSELMVPYARQVAISDGCPIPGEVIDLKGPWDAAKGYVDNNAIFTNFLSLVTIENPALGWSLSKPFRRSDPIGYFEDGAVPMSHTQIMAPQVRSWSAIRLIREGAKKLGDPIPEFPSFEDILKDVVRVELINPHIWLARLGEAAMKQGLDATVVLGIMFSKAYLREENCVRDFQKLAQAATQSAPELWGEYRKLQDANELDKYKISLVSPE